MSQAAKQPDDSLDTIFRIAGSNVFLHKKSDLVTVPTLPLGTYIVQATPEGTLFLARVEEMKNPSRMYGGVENRAKRIINTFEQRPGTTGVLLDGEKGTGKSLLAREISIQAGKHGYSTLLINAPWRGESFNRFIQALQHPVVLVFDEFEKVYDSEQQQEILTMLDGTFESKKLCVFTVNDPYRIGTYMMNRPGRIYYRYSYAGLDEQFVREYCVDNLHNQAHIDQVVAAAAMFPAFSFDSLKAMVEEMNRYSETAAEVLSVLNIRPDTANEMFDVTGIYRGRTITWNNNRHVTQCHGRGINMSDCFYINAEEDQKDLADDDGEIRVDIEPRTIKSVDLRSGTYVYTTVCGHGEITLKRAARFSNNIADWAGF